VLNVGAGETRYGTDVVNMEIDPGPGIDVVGVAEFLPFATRSCEGVILMAVLEHVQDADKTLSEAARVLDEGGRLLVDVPFIQGYHPSPGDYRRYTEQGLRTEVERFGFTVEDSGVAVGPASAMTWITAEFLALLLSGRSASAYRVARNITSLIASPIKYADYWLERHPKADRIPSAVWVLARRVDSPFVL
jgi:SAM-dependent methyltransferase